MMTQVPFDEGRRRKLEVPMFCRRFQSIAVGLLFVPLLLFADTVIGPDRRDIRGGTPTTHRDYPFVVFVQFWPGGCTGTLVAPDWVLTAAHCISDPDINSMEVIWGWPQDAAYRRVSDLYLHPYYDQTENGRQYDLALLKLDASIPASIVRLADAGLESYADAGRTLRIIGYAGNNGHMKFADAELAACPDGIPDEAYLCFPRRADPLGEPGDSGGPLLLRTAIPRPGAGEHREYVQMGVASAATTLGAVGWTRYTPVAPSLGWIRSVIAGSSSPLPARPSNSAVCPVPPESDSRDNGTANAPDIKPDGQRDVPKVCVPLGDRDYGLRIEYDTVPGTAGLMSDWWVGEKRVMFEVYVRDTEGVIWEIDEETQRSGRKWVARPRDGDDFYGRIARSMYKDCDDTDEYACRVDLAASPDLACDASRVKDPSGTRLNPDPDGTRVHPDGTRVQDGTRVHPDGTRVHPDGSTDLCLQLGETGRGVRLNWNDDHERWTIGEELLLAAFLGFYVRDIDGSHWKLWADTYVSGKVWKSAREGGTEEYYTGLFRENFESESQKDDGWIRAVDLQKLPEYVCSLR